MTTKSKRSPDHIYSQGMDASHTITTSRAQKCDSEQHGNCPRQEQHDECNIQARHAWLLDSGIVAAHGGRNMAVHSFQPCYRRWTRAGQACKSLVPPYYWRHIAMGLRDSAAIRRIGRMRFRRVERPLPLARPVQSFNRET